MKKKIFFMQGGLGNQICILSKAYEEFYKGCNIIIDLSSYQFNPHRKFQLQKYFKLINFKIREGNFISYLFFRITNKLMEILNRSEVNLYFFNLILYFGYFQENIDLRIDNLIKNFKFNDLKRHSSLCIHLRRGDYEINKFRKFHGIVSLQDVLKCMSDHKEFIKSNFSKITLITEGKNINFPKNFEGIDINLFQGSDHDAFLLMISAKGLIASNSSFSLLAGLLKKKDFFLIPDQWFVNKDSKFLGKSFNRYLCTLL